MVYAWAELLLPVVLAAAALWYFGTQSTGLMIAAFVGILGYLAPGLVLGRLIEKRKQEIRNGLPDALDLLIVCVEAGCSLDQAVIKTANELGVAYPALADELKILNIEVRAGKPRIEAFRNLAARTGPRRCSSAGGKLVQTDRFGTSVSQALRTHGKTLRTKRRQNAEERAHKIGVSWFSPGLSPVPGVLCGDARSRDHSVRSGVLRTGGKYSMKSVGFFATPMEVVP